MPIKNAAKPKTSLRFQINVSILLTGIVILILGGFIAIWQARTAVGKEIDSSLNLAGQLITLNFLQSQQNTATVSDWLPGFMSLEQTRHLKIQLKKPSGEIVKFTAAQNRAADVKTPPQWFINLVSQHYPDVEQHWTGPDGKRVTLSIQADPVDEITEAWQESGVFFMSLLVMALLTVVAVNLVFNKAFKAIGLITEGLKTIEQGDYQQKLPDFATREYDHIAKAINHMTSVLDAAHKENRALTLHSLDIQEEERQRLSQELHDELGQSLTAIKVMAVTANNQKAETGQITGAIIAICDHLISVVRSMMRNLHPLVLTELGLKATLEDLVDHWSGITPELALTLLCTDNVDALDKKITIQLFRIVQECVTNIVRHAQATQATIDLCLVAGKLLRLQVSDNGRGCDQETTATGFGLLGMRERANSLGGTLAIQTRSGQGMCITVNIPLR